MAKVVIDANVIISAAFGGNPLRAVIRAMEEDEVYLSQAIERELTEVFSKLSKKLKREQITFLKEKMRELVGMAKQVSVSTVWFCQEMPRMTIILPSARRWKRIF